MARHRLPKGIRIPPLPQFIQFTDRDDGTLWTLSHIEDDDGIKRITLNDEGTQRGPLREWSDVVVYEASDGLDLGQGVRLFVREGRIGYEMIDAEIMDPTPWTRRGVARETHQVLIPETWGHFPDELGWIEENGLE